jgi:hypothetical protein
MLIHKNICSSYFFTLLIISIIYFTSPSTTFGEDTTIYDPTKGKWVLLGTQCPPGAAGPANEYSSSLIYVRIYMQYKISQSYYDIWCEGGSPLKTADDCRDGSIVPEYVFSTPGYCLANFSKTQCVDFKGPDPGPYPPYEGEFPIYFRCYYINNAQPGWAYEVRAFCTSSITAYEWRLNDEPDPASNSGGFCITN